ncbi:MAG: pilus assembly protein PilX [Firmicutes bacterium]|nr:pilus assembly protein PilX [Bacillota bacterium]
MRKANAVISAVVMVLFIIHGIMGSMTLIGLGHINFKALSWVMLFLICVHTVIGIILTAKAVIVWRKTGAGYFKENKLFWARRISGFAIMMFIFFHVTAFSYMNYGVYRLKMFDGAKLITQMLLLLSVAVHVITNVRPMLIAFGIKKLKPRTGDILLFLSVMLFVMAIGFIVYYIRWNVL